MSKDGTLRGGRRPRSGERAQALVDKISAGKKASIIDVGDLPAIDDLYAGDFGDVSDIPIAETFPEPSAYLSAKQKDGTELGADLIYKEVYEWLIARGCDKLVSPRLVESYAQSFARYVQCESAISQFGLLGRHPTTNSPMATPFISMSQSFQKQAYTIWYEIGQIVKENCSVEYTGDPNTDAMERLLRSQKGN
jgi:hypothetical protein